MNITLYKCFDDPKRVIKRLEGLTTKTISVDFFSDRDIVNPIVVTHTNVTSNEGFTYAYIPDFKRYYFVNNPTAYKGSSTILYLECDVLMTAGDLYNLLNKEASIIRSGKAGVNQIPDKSLPIDPNSLSYKAFKFGSDLTTVQNLWSDYYNTPTAILVTV